MWDRKHGNESESIGRNATASTSVGDHSSSKKVLFFPLQNLKFDGLFGRFGGGAVDRLQELGTTEEIRRR
ncbi:hypothetical protein B296_00033480 [Ensete ventricosum]|uniref:Uncharacterized protein n=1 Tax=Ensete ventricosum TaxID=4639 RepID=A0A426Z222_ENSVE|nr:hypothetical protein B296_00033480 [Ensete ventricosum]